MPKIVNHEQYKDQILDQSFHLFARKGYEITMRELSRELKISTGTLYYYFKSKEDIFRQTMNFISQKQIDLLIERLGRDRSPEEKVKLALNYILNNERFFQNILFLIIDYYRQNDCKDPDQIIHEMADFYKTTIAEQLGFSNSILSSSFLSFTLGILIHRILDPVNTDWDEQIALIRSMVSLFAATGKEVVQGD
ncbi:MAG: TetR/AcrR family transcriptional regulator [Leptospiraceae bacterium]|nr:TetR/AcrR family transcriptional regulator [Leptospiraceae bacterium]